MVTNGIIQRKLSLLDTQIGNLKKYLKDIDHDSFVKDWGLSFDGRTRLTGRCRNGDRYRRKRLLFTRDQERRLHFYSLTCREYEHWMLHYEKQRRYRLEFGPQWGRVTFFNSLEDEG